MTADKSKKRLALVATALAMHVDRWQWRQLISSEHGPASPTTRHVLHVISLHMRELGTHAFMSQATLVIRTGLAPRTVKLHIASAKRTHWLDVISLGQNWRGNRYAATVPSTLFAVIPQHSKKGQDEPQTALGRMGHHMPLVGAPHAPTRGTTCPPKSSLKYGSKHLRGGAVEKSRVEGTRREHPDDLKSRSEKSRKLREQVAGIAKPPTRSSFAQGYAITDAELAVKVRKLRAIGQGDGDIRRALASQSSPAQLTRVLKSSM